MKKLLQLLRDNASAEREPLALVRNEAANEATLYIYDVIDAYWGVSANEVVRLVAGLDPATTLHTRINSPGGDVFEATAIATALRNHAGKTIAHVDGVCASAATDIACANDECEIGEGGFYMIHNAWTIVLGDKQDMLDAAALLAKVDGQIAERYVKRTAAAAEQVEAWMNAETWFTAQEAVDAGFCDRLAQPPAKTGTENTTHKAFNLRAYANTPAALLQTPAQRDTPDMAAHRARNLRRLQLLQID